MNESYIYVGITIASITFAFATWYKNALLLKYVHETTTAVTETLLAHVGYLSSGSKTFKRFLLHVYPADSLERKAYNELHLLESLSAECFREHVSYSPDRMFSYINKNEVLFVSLHGVLRDLSQTLEQIYAKDGFKDILYQWSMEHEDPDIFINIIQLIAQKDGNPEGFIQIVDPSHTT